MIISNKELEKFFSGAVYFKEENGIIPYRFTKEKLAFPDDDSNKLRLETTAGIRIDFYSDAQEISFDYTILSSCVNSLYNLYYFDVYVDNTMVLHQGGRDIEEGSCGKINLSLKKGKKRITIYLPSSCSTKISNFTVSDDSKMETVEYSKNVMFFGDSITHAAYIEFPSMSYVNILARKHNYNFVNQAIGGDIFEEKHMKFLPSFKPQEIYVAYGTNNFTNQNAIAPKLTEDFFSALKNAYGDTPTYVILPMWRGDLKNHPGHKHSFSEIRDITKKIAEKYNTNVLDGFDFVPQNELLMYDGFLHPNEAGFMFYAQALENAKSKIDK